MDGRRLLRSTIPLAQESCRLIVCMMIRETNTGHNYTTGLTKISVIMDQGIFTLHVPTPTFFFVVLVMLRTTSIIILVLIAHVARLIMSHVSRLIIVVLDKLFQMKGICLYPSANV